MTLNSRPFRRPLLAACTCVVLAGLVAALPGCSESPETRMQNAELALQSGKPDAALSRADQIVAEDPASVKGWRIKAMAHMQLGQADQARAAADKLVELDESDIEARGIQMNTIMLQIADTLSDSQFGEDEEAHERHASLTEQAKQLADWFDEHDDDIAETAMRRSRIARGEAERHRLILAAQRPAEALAGLDPQQQTEQQARIDQLTRDREAALDRASSFTRQAWNAEPGNWSAARSYVQLLETRRDWRELWIFIQEIAEVEKTPAELANRIIIAISTLPEGEQNAEARIEMSRRVLETIDEQQHDTIPYALASARLHLLADEPEAAVESLGSVLEREENHQLARYMLARAKFMQEEYAGARELLTVLATELPRSPDVQTLYGMTLVNLDDPVPAAEALRRAIEADPDNTIARRAMITLMASRNRLDSAEGEIDAFLSRDPDDPVGLRMKMQLEIGEGDRVSVQRLVERIAQIEPMTRQLRVLLIEGSRYLGDDEASERYARQLAQAEPDSVEAQLQLAEVLLVQNREAEARQILESLYEPGATGKVSLVLGELYLRTQQFDRASEVLEGYLESNPDSAPGHLALARSYAGLALMDDALRHVTLVLDQQPDHVDAHALASRIYQFTGDETKANQHLLSIDTSELDESRQPALLAQLALKQDREDDAVAILSRAIARGVSDPAVRLLLASIHAQNENWGQAELQLMSLVRNHPNTLRPYLRLAQYYVARQDEAGGEEALRQLQSINEPLSRLGQAVLLSGFGKPREAIFRLEPVFEPLIRSQERLAVTYADSLASLHQAVGDREMAVATWQKLIDRQFMPIEAKLRQIPLHHDPAKPEATIVRLDEISESVGPDERDLRYRLMNTYVAFNRPDRALQLLEEWATLEPDQPQLARWRGDLLRRMGQLEQAVEAYDEAIRLAPHTVELWRLKSATQVAAMDFPGARQTLLELAERDRASKIVAYAELGRLMLALGLEVQAVQAFDQLERTGRPGDPRVLLAIGRSFTQLDRLAQAKARLADIPDYAPQYAEAQLQIARIEQRQGEVDAARERLTRLIRERRNTAAAAEALFNLNVYNANDEQLLEWSNRAIQLEFLDDAAKMRWYRLRAGVHSRRGEWVDVRQTVEAMRNLAPNVPTLELAYWALLWHEDREIEAGQLAQRSNVLADTPFATWTRAVHAQTPDAPGEQVGNALAAYLIHLMRNDPEAAERIAGDMGNDPFIFARDLVAVAKRSDATSPAVTNAARQTLAALAASVAGLPDLAVQLAREAQQLSPRFIPAYAVEAAALQRTRESVDDLADKLDTAVPTAIVTGVVKVRSTWRNLGPDEAVRILDNLLQRAPEQPELMRLRAAALLRGEDFDAAIQAYEQLWSMQDIPLRVEIGNNLAYLLAEHQPDRLDEAAAIADELIELAPNNVALLDTRGWIRLLQGDVESARSDLKRALVGLPGLPEVQFHVAKAYAMTGVNEWAKLHVDEALREGQWPGREKAEALRDSLPGASE